MVAVAQAHASILDIKPLPKEPQSGFVLDQADDVLEDELDDLDPVYFDNIPD
jgi:hypothetical protein